MTVIILNGPSSSGKTSIAKAIQKLSESPWLLTGLDQFIFMLPEHMNDYHGDMQQRKGFYWHKRMKDSMVYNDLVMGDYGRKVYDLFKSQVKQMAENGFNVIVDHVALVPNDYAEWVRSLAGHTVVFVKVTASPDILDQRELQRGDRIIGGSRAQQEWVHNDFIYDIEVDSSSQSSELIAKYICLELKNCSE